MTDIPFEHVIKDAPEGIAVPLVWPKTDKGCWGEYKPDGKSTGPLGDWFSSHKGFVEGLKRKRVCIQAGAACGMYPLFLSNYFEQVYCFEPSTNYKFAEYNVRNATNILLYEYALDFMERSLYMKLNAENVGMNKIGGDQPQMGDHVTESVILDKFVPICDLDFIWLDIEGYEINALQGAKNHIERCKPVIAIERPNNEVNQFLKEFGYTKENTKKSKMDVFFYPENY